jgi:hypothetical protein
MTSPQRHRDPRENPYLPAGDAPAAAPCSPCLGGDDLCKTNPMSEGFQVRSFKCQVRRSAIPPSDFKRQTSNFTLADRQSCKTKPNLEGLGHIGKGPRAGRGPAGGQNTQNEPNLGRGPRIADWKRPPAGGGRRHNAQNEPNLATGGRCRAGLARSGTGCRGNPRRAETYKTNPISSGRGRVTEENVQNKAKLRRTGVYGQRSACGLRLGRWAQRAKRTQFGPAGGQMR